MPLGKQIDPPVKENRLCIVGPTFDGRLVSVVFTIRNDKVRPISGRDASRKEKRLYEEISKALKGL